MSRLLRQRLLPRWLFRLPSGCGGVSLTFDDGPDARSTPRLLSALEKLAVPCSHFVNGSKCAAAGNLLSEARALGHAIGNHGFEHSSQLFSPAVRQRESLRRTHEEIRRHTGEECLWFRPPFGHFNPWTGRVMTELRYSGVLWSLMPHDWKASSEADLWRRILVRLQEGDIIVLHDTPATVALLIPILTRLAEEVARRGWEFLPLPAPAFEHRA